MVTKKSWKEFHICDYKVGYFIVEAIATSLDRLLLETID